jgi:anti-sigma B factor antagonist
MPELILKVTAGRPTATLTVLHASGEIDRDSVPVLVDAAEDALDDGADRLVVDLAAVTFCDSSGLSVFVQLHRRAAARGGSFALAAVQPPVRMVLQATNLDRLLEVHPTVDEAVRAGRA